MQNSSLYDIVTPSLETYLNKKASINCPLQITLMYEVGLECQCLPLTIYLETFSGKIILKHSFSMQISSHLQKSHCRTKSSNQTLTSNPSVLGVKTMAQSVFFTETETQTKDKLKPTHGLACTSRMRKTISPGQWQPWTAVSLLLGPKVCLIQLVRTSHRPKTSAYPFEYFKRYITHTDCQLSFNGHLKRLTHPLQGQLEGLSDQLISLYKAYKTARLSIVRLRDNLLYITYTTTKTALFARL